MTPEDIKTALLRAVATTQDADLISKIATMLTVLHAVQKNEAENAKARPVKQEWARRSQVANYFGVTKQALSKWLPELVAKKKIRTITPPGNGWTLYNIHDIEQALTIYRPI